MPIHVGIKGKGSADSLTRRAAMVEGRTMDCADNWNAIGDHCQNEFARSELDSTSGT